MMYQKRTFVFTVLLLFLTSVPLIAATSHKELIKGPINSGPEATQKCLECHEDAAVDFMQTSHWNWSLQQEVNGKIYKRGKRNALNNYCTSVASNESACARCHAGYGMVDGNFDFSDKSKVDCLVCHDNTGTYAKGTSGGGLPKEDVNLLRVAQNVGKPLRENCGSCHFFGGGGDAVKHGDLDSSMFYPEKSTDIHMAADGNDFTCQTCHVTENHAIPGNSIGVSPGGMSQLACTDCHEAAPHTESRLNAHVDAVACQTCHIPFFAKEIATKTWWDWSTAGDQERKAMKDKYGKPSYVAKKGDMEYAKMITPEYAWYQDGKNEAYVRGEKIDPSQILVVAGPTAARSDREALIFPFKVMKGKQIYDSKNKTLIAAHLIGKDGFWKTFDWKQAAEIGMKAAGLPFSGEYDFVETVMYWRLNHMVSPKEEALECLDCHGDQGRLNWKELGYPGDPIKNPAWARR